MGNILEIIKIFKPVDEWEGVKSDGGKDYYHD